MLRAWRRHHNKGTNRAHIYTEIGEIMATDRYTINGQISQDIIGGHAEINMKNAIGVKAGCYQYPVPLLNKITVTSTEGVLTSQKTIYAGYKIIQQMLGSLVAEGNYNPNTSTQLSSIIQSGRVGIFEPALYNSTTRGWSKRSLSDSNINSLINLGTGIKICVKIVYKKISGTLATEYLPITVVSANFDNRGEIDVPTYSSIGASSLPSGEIVGAQDVEYANRRPWFEYILTEDDLNVNLGFSITEPDTTVDIKVTLMAYIGSPPTPNNTFPILPMLQTSQTSVEVPFETYEPGIFFANKDTNNLDNYTDTYGSVHDYNPTDETDTTISVTIAAPQLG